MRLDLEGDRVTLPNVNHARVLADASEQFAGRSLRRQLGELAQMHLGGLVRAVLGPHDGVHGELGRGRSTAQDLLDPGVFAVLQTQLRPWLCLTRGSRGVADSVCHGRNATGAGRC